MPRLTRRAILLCGNKSNSPGTTTMGRTEDSPYEEISGAQGPRKQHQGWSRSKSETLCRNVKTITYAAEAVITQTPSTHLSKAENSKTAMVTRASGRSQSKLKCKTHPSVVPTFTWERGSFIQEGSVEFLNDKPTAIIRKASSIHNFEFNLIRHPANFITYLTGLLIQFTLLLFQITAPGPMRWETHGRTHLGML